VGKSRGVRRKSFTLTGLVERASAVSETTAADAPVAPTIARSSARARAVEQRPGRRGRRARVSQGRDKDKDADKDKDRGKGKDKGKGKGKGREKANPRIRIQAAIRIAIRIAIRTAINRVEGPTGSVNSVHRARKTATTPARVERLNRGTSDLTKVLLPRAAPRIQEFLKTGEARVGRISLATPIVRRVEVAIVVAVADGVATAARAGRLAIRTRLRGLRGRVANRAVIAARGRSRLRRRRARVHRAGARAVPKEIARLAPAATASRVEPIANAVVAVVVVAEVGARVKARAAARTAAVQARAAEARTAAVQARAAEARTAARMAAAVGGAPTPAARSAVRTRVVRTRVVRTPSKAWRSGPCAASSWAPRATSTTGKLPWSRPSRAPIPIV